MAQNLRYAVRRNDDVDTNIGEQLKSNSKFRNLFKKFVLRILNKIRGIKQCLEKK